MIGGRFKGNLRGQLAGALGSIKVMFKMMSAELSNIRLTLLLVSPGSIQESSGTILSTLCIFGNPDMSCGWGRAACQNAHALSKTISRKPVWLMSVLICKAPCLYARRTCLIYLSSCMIIWCSRSSHLLSHWFSDFLFDTERSLKSSELGPQQSQSTAEYRTFPKPGSPKPGNGFSSPSTHRAQKEFHVRPS